MGGDNVEEELKFFSHLFSKVRAGEASNLQISDRGITLKEIKKYMIDSVIHCEYKGENFKIEDFAVSNNHYLYFLDENKNIWQHDYNNDEKKILFRKYFDRIPSHISFTICGEFIIFAHEEIEILSLNTGQIMQLIDSREETVINNYYTYEEGLKEDTRDYYQNIKNAKIKVIPIAVTSDDKENIYVVVPLDGRLNFNLEQVKNEAEEYNMGTVANNSEIERLGILQINIKTNNTFLYEIPELKLNKKLHISLVKSIIHLEISNDGELLVLNSETRKVVCVSALGSVQHCIDIKTEGFPISISIDLKGNMFIGETESREEEIDYNKFLFRYDKNGCLLEKISGVKGKIDKVLIDRNDNIFVFSKEQNAVTVFRLKNRINGRDFDSLPKGTYISTSLDSFASQTIWHKFMLNAKIPKDTQVELYYFALEDKFIKVENKDINIDEFIKDEKISFAYKMQILEPYWSKPLVNPKDALINSTEGRYLWYRLELLGSKENTPLLESIRIYYPRTSYLRYLPSIYQNDKKSKDFLERYLSIYETILMNMEEKIDKVSQYFDPDYVTGDFLKWLLSWMKISVSDGWSDDKLKLLLKRCSEIYKIRGTRKGLKEIIELYTGRRPYIIEFYEVKNSLKNPELESLFNKLYNISPYSFCVLIEASVVRNTKSQLEVEKIINSEKPAFTEGNLILLEDNMCLDSHCYMGINSILAKSAKFNLDNKTTLTNGISLDGTAKEEKNREHKIGSYFKLK